MGAVTIQRAKKGVRPLKKKKKKKKRFIYVLPLKTMEIMAIC
jgi:hypothetical protein